MMDKKEIRQLIEKEIEKTTQKVASYEEMSQPITPDDSIGRISRMDAINNKSVAEVALERELFEEFKVKTRTGRYIGVNEHDYGSFEIKLLFYESKYVSGEWELSDHDKLKWVSVRSLKSFDLADADIPIIDELVTRLP